MVSGRGASGGGGDDYDWLYSPPDSADADATRRIPVSPRPVAGGSAGPGGSGRPPERPPGSIAPTPRDAPAARQRGRRPWLRWLGIAVLAWLVYLVAVPIYAWTTVSTVDITPEGTRPEEQPGTTYLVVGSDARSGLGGARTDTIMMLHSGRGPNLLLSIPRDSIVEVPGVGTTKVNAAFALNGPPLLVQTLEAETGVRIDQYVEIGFRGLVRLVDAVGGITICPETAISDPDARLDIEAGCQEAGGRTALGYARSRKSQDLGDVDRARHQREVVTAIGSEVLSWQTLVNPVRYWRTVTAGASAVRVSESLGPFGAARFLLGMTRTGGESGMTCGVPIRDLAVTWDDERADALFALIAQDRTREVGGDLCRPSGLPEGS